MKRTIYYSDMMNDDFADNGIKRKKLPRDYQYISKDPLRRTADFMLHHFVATPIAYIFQKVVYCEKIVNRKVLQPYLKTASIFTAIIHVLPEMLSLRIS